jgi:hypothetical protein
MTQTAVEWLAEQMEHPHTFNPLIEKALQMEKQQLIEANIAGMEFIAVDPNRYKEDAEKYYKETFKNK